MMVFIKGTISDPQFQTSLFFSNPQIILHTVFRQNFTVINYPYNNFLGNSILLERQPILFCWVFLVIIIHFFDFLKFQCIFLCGTEMLTFLNDYICILVISCVLIDFIERKVMNFTPKFRGILLWRKTMSRAHGMKFYKKSFFCKNYAVF